MTTTIGLPYDDLRPHVVRPKRSFLQRLNETHEQLISHMRSLKVEEPTLSTKHHGPSMERMRTMSTVSLTSTSGSEREYFQSTDSESESPMSSGFLSPPLSPADGSSFPIHQYLSPKDRKSSHEYIKGMQSYVNRKQATYESMVQRSLPISPPQTPPLDSASSLKSAKSEMSDEQIDDWLDRPMDAELHRFQKLSASGSEYSTDSEDDENKIHVIVEQPDEEDNAAHEERLANSARWRETWCMQKAPECGSTASLPYKVNDAVSGDVWAKEAEAEAEAEAEEESVESKLLLLPIGILETVASHLQKEDVRSVRLSCTKLNSLLAAPLST
ncbi:hypothetical protein L13192_02802 [Pyrenophora tritici-repentis]|uniref:F-box domain-containing protein n=1 Tax=Pyrenophora tritici-repentis (strain Pt-1C-BFP) TaxID=426418 RepID=B2VY86_PYRTR|nr:uncharacterized protein PTRG_02376 [Pyrenophora tritici-repentis Pt-1C-BFP]EDU44899.1 predicted protein [Pyrenophora tritici-repentis Pt-1C-BFP]KAI1671943.1 hypothetical protein L13192_02802 [Pyrenophora tritici-repentis]